MQKGGALEMTFEERKVVSCVPDPFREGPSTPRKAPRPDI